MIAIISDRLKRGGKPPTLLDDVDEEQDHDPPTQTGVSQITK